jgi:ATP-dependent Clp protease adaptor protein ClpS
VATEFETFEEIKIEEPKMYKVILLNDDYSTMDFVIEVLMKVFRKTLEQSTVIMLNIHNNGQEVCGVYTHEIALTKSAQVRNMARARNFPLKAIVQED